MEPTRLAVDLGTSHTVAVVRRGTEAPRALLFDSSPLLPSGVYAQPGGGLHVGRDAERLSVMDPSRFEPYPKRGIDEGTVLLGDTEIPVTEMLAALLRRVVDEARMAGIGDPGAPGATVLTCPADWGRQRRAVLLAAAYAAGLGQVRLIEEPIAAATYCERVLRHQIAPGQCLAIFDFGGGTLDVSVVRRDPDALRVLSVGGLDNLGGVDIDDALVGHLGQLIAIRQPELWQRLANPAGIGELRDRRAFWSEVRGAKEMLSRAAAAPIQVPGGEAVHLTREELERVAGPLIDRAVDETRRVLQRAGIGIEQLAGIFLVGGSSRIPLVAHRLHTRFRLAPSVPEQPELPVAYGALLAASEDAAPSGGVAPNGGAASNGSSAPPPLWSPGSADSLYPGAPISPGVFGTEPVTPAGFSPASVSGAGPVSGGPAWSPTSGAAISGGFSAAPTSGSPPYEATPYTPSYEATPYTPPGGYPAPPSPPPKPARTSRLAPRLVAIGTAVLLVLVGGGYAVSKALKHAAAAGTDGGGTNGGGGAGTTLRESRTAIKLTGAGESWAISDGRLVYYAEVLTGKTQVTAVPVDGGENVWNVVVPMEPTALHLTIHSGLLIVDGKQSASDAGTDARAVLDLASGALKWHGQWVDQLDVAYVGTDAIVETRGSKPATQRVDLLTGRVKWSHPGKVWTIKTTDRLVGAVLTWPADPASAAPKPYDDPDFSAPGRAVFRDSLDVDTSVVVEIDPTGGKGSVVDTGTGQARRTGGVTLDDDVWTVFDGVIVGKASDNASPGKDVIYAYNLADLSKKWELPLKAGDSIEAVRPCGQHLVCVAINLGVGDKAFAAINVATGKEAWRNPVEFRIDSGWYLVGGNLLYGDQTFVNMDEPTVLNPASGNARPFGTARQFIALAADRSRVVLQSVTNSEISVADLGTGDRGAGISAGDVVHVCLIGDVLTILTKDHQLKVFRVPAA